MRVPVGKYLEGAGDDDDDEEDGVPVDALQAVDLRRAARIELVKDLEGIEGLGLRHVVQRFAKQQQQQCYNRGPAEGT